MTTRSGADSTTALITWPTSVADRISRPGGTGPRRSARRRTWWADSSADTRRTRWPAPARAASTWSRRVDLPMPGSPPEQRDRSRDQAPRQHAVELLDAGGHGRRLRQVDRGQGHGEARQVEFVHGPDERTQRRLLHQGVPLPTGRAAPGPPGGRRAAVDAAVALGRLCHVPMVGTGCAIGCDPGPGPGHRGARGPGRATPLRGGPEGRRMPDPDSGGRAVRARDPPCPSGEDRGHCESPAITSRTPARLGASRGEGPESRAGNGGCTPRTHRCSTPEADAPRGPGDRRTGPPAGGGPDPVADAPRPRHQGRGLGRRFVCRDAPAADRLSRRRSPPRRAPSAGARCPRSP